MCRQYQQIYGKRQLSILFKSVFEEAKRRSNAREMGRASRAALLADGCHAVAYNDVVDR
jgi:3-deoxy-D-manno-octulosonic acid (KDO) 8-phosphate synthase